MSEWRNAKTLGRIAESSLGGILYTSTKPSESIRTETHLRGVIYSRPCSNHGSLNLAKPMNPNTTVFDVETSGLSPTELAAIEPEFKSPANYKKPEAIEAYIAESRASWRERAALSALTGRVLAIGIRKGDTNAVWGVESEGDMLQLFWDHFSDERNGENYVGFNIKHFDLPFLVQRSFVKGVKVPANVFDGRYWSHRFVDLQERWLCFGRESTGASLDAVCRACGLGGKTGSGAYFARLWQSDRDAAIGYLNNDLTLTAKLAERLL